MIQCEATRTNGERCRATALPKRSQCFAHDPDNRELAMAARSKGGTGRSNAARIQKRLPREVRDIVMIVEQAMGGVLNTSVTPSQGHALASLAGAWVRLHELGEMDARLEALETASTYKGYRA